MCPPKAPKIKEPKPIPAAPPPPEETVTSFRRKKQGDETSQSSNRGLGSLRVSLSSSGGSPVGLGVPQ